MNKAGLHSMDAQQVVQLIRRKDLDTDHSLAQYGRMMEHASDAKVRVMMRVVGLALAELDDGDKLLDVLASYSKRLFPPLRLSSSRGEVYRHATEATAAERVEDIVELAFTNSEVHVPDPVLFEIWNDIRGLIKAAVRARDSEQMDPGI